MSGALETVKLETVLCPISAPFAEIQRLFGLSYGALKDAAETGKVRWFKTGEGKRSGVYYNVKDVYEWMFPEGERGI